MKKTISFMFIVLLFCISSSHAAVTGERIILNVSGSDVCGLPETCPTNYVGQLPTNCTSALSLADSALCVCVYIITCDDTVASYEDATVQYYQGQTVPAGQEAQFAEDTFNTIMGPLPYPTPVNETYRLTSSFSGYIYQVNAQPDNTSLMDITMWKRAGFTKVGSPDGILTPLDVVSGGAGASPAQVESAVQSALASQGLSSTDIMNAVSDAINNYVYNYNNGGLLTQEDIDGLANAIGNAIGSGGTGGGLNQTETQAAVEGALNSALGSGSSSGSGSVTASQSEIPFSNTDDIFDDTLVEPEKDSITTKVSNFMSSNPVLSIFSNSYVSASAGSCSFSTDIFGKTVTIDFCSTAEHLQLFGSLILIVGSIYSFFIAWGRG